MEVENQKKTKGISLRAIGITVSSVTAVIASLLIVSLFLLSSNYRKVNQSTQEYMEWENVASDIQAASDHLTSEVRSFVVTYKKEHMDSYFYEANVSKRRENALDILEENLKDTDVHKYVTTAINNSMELMNDEFYAMRLVSDVKGVDYSSYEEIVNVEIKPEDAAKSDEAKLSLAIDMVFGTEYKHTKGIITTNISKAVSTLDLWMKDDVLKSSKNLKTILILQQALIALHVALLIGVFVVVRVFITKPLRYAVSALQNDEHLPQTGAKEFLYITDIYNNMYDQNKDIKKHLIYEAEHDKLTKLYNRTGYDSIYKRLDLENTVYILIDGDNFKEINDKYGHSIGDKVLIRLAKVLNKYFGHEVHSYIFRIGGDEFSVLIEHYDGNDDKLIEKLNAMKQELSEKSGEIPAIFLSIGIAHGKHADTTDTLFRKADKALYEVKKHGRNGIRVSK